MAHKYSGSIEQALLANANCGGENVHRGIVLGALFGAAEGYKAIDPKWIKGLKDHSTIEAVVEEFVAKVTKQQ